MVKRMRVDGIWRTWLMRLILVLTLIGVSQVFGAEVATPEPAAPKVAEPSPPPPAPVSPAPAAPVPPVSPPATVTPPTPAQGEYILKSFRIEGNDTVRTKDLIKEISLKKPSFWPPWAKPVTIRLQDLEYYAELIKKYYRRQGFYHTKVTPKITYDSEREVSVTLKIDEGPWVKVTDINVEVAGTVDLSDLPRKWPLNIGDRFAEKPYEDLKNLYLNYLPNHGYPKVKVRGRVYLNQDNNTARILIHVNPGALCYFGGVNIQDEEKLETPPAVIRQKVSFKAGDIFNLQELFDTQRKLYATNLFKSVVLTPEQVPPQEVYIPVDIQLEEKKKRSVKLGVGYGDEEKVRARLGLIYRNLFGGGRLLTLDAKYSTLGYLYTQSFLNPALFNSKFDLVNETGVRRRYLPGFNDQAYFTQSRLERDLPWNLRVYFGHGLEFARPFDLPVETLIMFAGTEPEKMYRASFALLGLRQDTTDNTMDPHRGGIMVFANQFAPDFFGSGLQFIQSVLDLKRYQAIGDTDFILAGRVRGGLIQPVQSTTEIPLSRRFFSGGATSVRGYQLDYLSPRNPSNNPIGGEAVVEFSLEGRFPLPIYQKIGGVVFIDAGNVYQKLHQFDLGNLKYSPGFGLRYRSPIGPIGIDVAFPTNRINYQQDSRYQIHFTVGYGF